MLGWILLAIGIAGFGAAGYLDLKTTEFPDWLPYTMIIGALAARAAYSFLLSDWSIITGSVIWGVLFLAIGMAMYFTRQWGDGDAWLLGALGFLFPDAAGFTASAAAFPFPVVMIFNFFFISFFYLIAYSLVLGLSSPKVSSEFAGYLRGNSKSIVSMVVLFFAFCAAVFLYMHFQFGLPMAQLAYVIMFPALFAALIIFLHYGRFIEGRLFKRRISVKDLRAGDVPVGKKWRVLSEKEVAAFKKKGGSIWIKEGVRFAPVFIITMLFTLFLGNLISVFFAL